MVFTTEKQSENTQSSFFKSLQLTDREIDILACLHSGKANKKIAVVLSLSPATVKKHSYNVMQKMDKHTRESVVDCLDQAGQSDYLTARFKALIKCYEFNKLRLKLEQQVGSQKKICHIVCDKPALLEELRQDLLCFGIKIVTKHVQTSVARMTIITMSSKGSVANITAIHGCLVYTGDYYGLFWDVLEEVVIHPAIKKARLSFEETFAEDSDVSNKSDQWSRLDSFIDRLEATVADQQGSREFLPLWKKFRPLYYGPLAAFIMGCFALPALQETSLFTTKTAVRSALSLPIDAYLLERPALLSKITNAFKNKGSEKIQTVVLVGMGGMGKTTLARHYARKQSFPVIFELAAQDPKTLLSSFAKLAFALAETPPEKKEIESWQHIENTKAYADKIVPFVAKKLKEKKAKAQQWLLIFDNVDRFEDIESFLPQDPQIWGQGHILMTTRSEHMTCRDNIDPNHVIAITPLSVEEQGALFKKVLHRPVSKGEQKELSQFLTKLPPFPLDVMVAAHYIKRTKTSYRAYLRHLTEMHRQFEASQHIFLTRATSYDQTRMAIISSAVKQIVAKNPAFIPLLWIVSHLGEQPIPKDLLICADKQLVVDQFIDELTHYSLLIGNDDLGHKEERGSQILLHRSTQQNMQIYLERSVDDKQKQRCKDVFVQALEDYGHQMMVPPIDLGVMKDFTGHLHVVLESKTNLLSSLHRSCFQLLLGSLYFYLADSTTAKLFLEPSLAYLSTYYQHTPHNRLRRVLLFSGITARSNGDYEEARILLEKNVKICDSTILSDSPTILAMALRHLSYVYVALAKYDKAKEAIERSISLYTKYAPQHGDLALAYSDLAAVYYGGPGDYDKAIFYRLKSLNMLVKNEGLYHQTVLMTNAKLSMDYRRVGDYMKSKKILATTYSALKKYYPYDVNNVSWIATKFGEIYRLIGKAQQAECFLKEGVAIAAQYFGKEHIHTDWGRIPLAQLYTDVGQYDQAKELLERSLKGHKKKFGDTHDKTISVHHPLGLVYAYLGEKEKALDCFIKSQESFAKHYGETHIDYAIFLKDFGKFYVLMGSFEQAEILLKQALTILEKARHIERYRCFEYLGDLYAEKSQMIKAHSDAVSADHLLPKACRHQADVYFQEALKIMQDKFPTDSFHIVRVRAKRKALLAL